VDLFSAPLSPALDSNQNGVLDLVELADAQAQLAAADAQIVLLTTQLSCGDLDGDGEVGGADIGLVLLNFGPCTQ
jgi:hypothetical protein